MSVSLEKKPDINDLCPTVWLADRQRWAIVVARRFIVLPARINTQRKAEAYVKHG